MEQLKNKKQSFEKWKIQVNSEVKGGIKVYSAEKISLIEKDVRITAEQANTLNAGILSSQNTVSEMLYLPGAEEPFKL